MVKRAAVLVLATCIYVASANAQTSVCVEVELRAWSDIVLDERTRDARSLAGAVGDAVLSGLGEEDLGGERFADDPPPIRVDESALRLRRLIQYEVTHTPGFVASRPCEHHIRVELYELDEGWTAFARYEGTSREEKVDQVRSDELGALAARLTSALLADESLDDTLTRTTVLRDDSEGVLRRVSGTGHTRFSIGTELIVGFVPTARSPGTVADDRLRINAPLAVDVGARNTYRGWALDSYLGMLIGTARQSIAGAGAGHADYTFGVTAALHFLRYVSPDAAASVYGGGGASFQVHRYRILPGDTGDDDGLVGGGLNLDLMLGYEVMRASALSFFVELQAHLPTYGFDSENDNGRIRAWLPAVVAQIGLLR